jgi:hypothetical protein
MSSSDHSILSLGLRIWSSRCAQFIFSDVADYQADDGNRSIRSLLWGIFHLLVDYIWMDLKEIRV